MSGVASRRHLREKYVWAHSQMWCSFDVSLEIVQYDSDWTMWDWIVVGLSVELLQQETKIHHPMKQEVFSCSVGRTLWHINFSLVQAAFDYWRELYPLFFGHGFADLERPHFRTPEKNTSPLFWKMLEYESGSSLVLQTVCSDAYLRSYDEKFIDGDCSDVAHNFLEKVECAFG